jgi:hypothetical protein
MLKRSCFALAFMYIVNVTIFGMAEPEANYSSPSHPSDTLLSFLPLLILAIIIGIPLVLHFILRKKIFNCSKCKQETQSAAKFCTKCGNNLKIGKSIASFILSCIGLLFATNIFVISFFIYRFGAVIIVMGIWLFLFITPALILGIISLKKQKYLFAKVGVLYSIASIVMFLFSFIRSFI